MSASEPITISVVHLAPAIVLAVSGEVDAVTAPVLDGAIAEVLSEDPATMIVDLSGVTFLGSIGLEILVQAHERASKTGRFAVVADGPVTRRPIELTSVDEVIALYRSLDDALTGG